MLFQVLYHKSRHFKNLDKPMLELIFKDFTLNLECEKFHH